MSFRAFKTYLTESPGAYMNGVWLSGTRSEGTIYASVQPAMQGQDMQALPEGRRWSDFAKIYTDTRLNVVEDGEGVQPDFVVHEGWGYELVSLFAHRSGVINHYKYIAVRSFPVPSVAEWINGSILRK